VEVVVTAVAAAAWWQITAAVVPASLVEETWVSPRGTAVPHLRPITPLLLPVAAVLAEGGDVVGEWSVRDAGLAHLITDIEIDDPGWLVCCEVAAHLDAPPSAPL
jgi:hypothetical protein